MKLFRSLAVLVLLVSAAFASTQTFKGATVDAPVALTTKGPESGTTAEGAAYTRTTYAGELANEDIYAVAIASYPFQLAATTPKDTADGFVRGIGGGAVISQQAITVSNQPALSTVVDKDVNGRTLRFFIVTSYRGSTAYVFIFTTWLDTPGTDKDAVKQFFLSISF